MSLSLLVTNAVLRQEANQFLGYPFQRARKVKGSMLVHSSLSTEQCWEKSNYWLRRGGCAYAHANMHACMHRTLSKSIPEASLTRSTIAFHHCKSSWAFLRAEHAQNYAAKGTMFVKSLPGKLRTKEMDWLQKGMGVFIYLFIYSMYECSTYILDQIRFLIKSLTESALACYTSYVSSSNIFYFLRKSLPFVSICVIQWMLSAYPYQ